MHSRLHKVETYKDRATFAHLYGAEPHPITPGTNFDWGIPIPQYWSATGQHRNYQDRLNMAAKIVATTHPEQARTVAHSVEPVLSAAPPDGR